jgi:hypothetical protein
MSLCQGGGDRSAPDGDVAYQHPDHPGRCDDIARRFGEAVSALPGTYL